MSTSPAGNILDALLFGSQARGDADAKSDVDVLLVTDAGRPIVGAIQEQVARQLGCGCDLSIYSLTRLESMYREGHLFAWHLFREAIPLGGDYTGAIVRNLGRPAPYRTGLQDARELSTLVQTVCKELPSSESIVFECGLLYVAARNIALSASWYSSGGVNFGRYSPYSLGDTSVQLSLSISDYDTLVASRHASTRGGPPPYLSRERAIVTAQIIQRWTLDVCEWISKREHKCPLNAIS